MDVDEIKTSTDLHKLLRLWDQAVERGTWQYLADMYRAEGDEKRLRVAERELAKEPEVSALCVLAANARMVELLTGWRWVAMRDAREEGCTWQEIGDALSISRQSAHELYARNRAALNEGESK